MNCRLLIVVILAVLILDVVILAVMILTYSLFDDWSNKHCKNHLDQVCWNKWKHTYCKGSLKSRFRNYAEPYCTKEVANSGSDYHSNQMYPDLVELVYYNSCYDCHSNKSDNISTCWTDEFGRTRCKPRKYWDTDKSD